MAMRGHMRFVVCMCFAALGGTAATTEMRMMMLCLMPVSSAELQLRRLQTRPLFTNTLLKSAVLAFNDNPSSAEATYGPISGWDVSAVTRMYELFKDLRAFNADISGWETSGVTDMSYMFKVRSAHALPPLSS